MVPVFTSVSSIAITVADGSSVAGGKMVNAQPSTGGSQLGKVSVKDNRNVEKIQLYIWFLVSSNHPTKRCSVHAINLNTSVPLKPSALISGLARSVCIHTFLTLTITCSGM